MYTPAQMRMMSAAVELSCLATHREVLWEDLSASYPDPVERSGAHREAWRREAEATMSSDALRHRGLSISWLPACSRFRIPMRHFHPPIPESLRRALDGRPLEEFQCLTWEGRTWLAVSLMLVNGPPDCGQLLRGDDVVLASLAPIGFFDLSAEQDDSATQ